MRLDLLSLSFCSAILVGSAIAQPGIHPDEIKLKPKIDAAIASGVEALINGQYRDGTWGQFGAYPGGKTALCTYALLKCGVSVDHPSVRRALLYLNRIKPEKTYSLACMMLAYAAIGRPEYLDRMKKYAKLLISWQNGGDYGYPRTRADLSNTQYAALGLWIAQKHKIKVPVRVWLQLANATLGYAEKRTKVDTPVTGEHTVRNGGKIEIAGFGYRPRVKPTGSMTTAGVSILQICKIGLGSKIGGHRRKIDRAIDAGVNWLAHNFSVDSNPGKRDWDYYYLYGLERVGSLTRTEKIGNHWWYLEGARHLLDEQLRDGSWPGGKDKQELRTSFALLFLRRATTLEASDTGRTSKRAGPRHLFKAGTEKDDVSISGAGQQPLALWVAGFGKTLQERHKQYGLRIVQVEYLDGDRVLGQLVGSPTKAWKLDTFLHRVSSMIRGTHKIRARVKLVAPEVATGGLTPTETVLSAEMPVAIRDIFADWMKSAAELADANLIRRTRFVATASSASKSAKKAIDGKETTHWICGSADPNPTLMIEFKRPVLAKNIVISQAGSRIIDVGLYDRIKVVEIQLNRDKPLRVVLDPDPIGITRIALPKARNIRTMHLRILERVPGIKSGQAGFTEIALTR